MITACTIIGIVVSCLAGPAPKPAPAASAALLAPWAYRPPPAGTEAPGPNVILIAGNPAHGPFGPVVATPPDRRLDGTLLVSPPWVAVHPLWFPGTRPHTTRVDGQRRR